MSGRIQFKPKPEKVVEAILYLTLKGVHLDQYKVVKLLYLADREHFRRFGRPITFDRYLAMPFGPVGDTAYDVAQGKPIKGFKPGDFPFDVEAHDKIKRVKHAKREIDRSLFSRSDLEVLDQVVDEHGNKDFGDLYDLTHGHFAYKRAWSNANTRADEMRYEDFLDEHASKAERVSDLEFTSKGM